MEALENHKNSLCILGIDADAVVFYREQPILLALLDADVDFRRLMAAKLYSIADQVLEKLRNLCVIHIEYLRELNPLSRCSLIGTVAVASRRHEEEKTGN